MGLPGGVRGRRLYPGEAFAAWAAEIERGRRIEASVESLDDEFHVDSWRTQVSLRIIMMLLVHEYARENGHADLLREGVDGETGS